METSTREEALKSRSVHNLTKNILLEAANKDCLDRVYDVELALRILVQELQDLTGIEYHVTL